VNLEQGIELAGCVLAGELQCRHVPIALETLLLRSQIYATLGDVRNTRADILQALELAEPEGFVSIFLEEGKEGRWLIEDCRMMIEKRGDERLINFTNRLLAKFPTVNTSEDRKAISTQKSSLNNSSNLVEPLTHRELEVLHLIAAGDSNKMIAEKLVITLSAVKKHTGNIFGKLGVNSRTQAVARARELGLLSSAP
jgi:ATP/maltotriose-dependent transcriptional regulator MalT